MPYSVVRSEKGGWKLSRSGKVSLVAREDEGLVCDKHRRVRVASERDTAPGERRGVVLVRISEDCPSCADAAALEQQKAATRAAIIAAGAPAEGWDFSSSSLREVRTKDFRTFTAYGVTDEVAELAGHLCRWALESLRRKRLATIASQLGSDVEPATVVAAPSLPPEPREPESFIAAFAGHLAPYGHSCPGAEVVFTRRPFRLRQYDAGDVLSPDERGWRTSVGVEFIRVRCARKFPERAALAAELRALRSATRARKTAYRVARQSWNAAHDAFRDWERSAKEHLGAQSIEALLSALRSRAPGRFRAVVEGQESCLLRNWGDPAEVDAILAAITAHPLTP
jgi:hypothetical protein